MSFKKITGNNKPKEVANASKLEKKEGKNIPMVQFIREKFNKGSYGDFDKVLVAKELVNIIEPKDLEKDEYKPLGKLFEKVKEYLELE